MQTKLKEKQKLKKEIWELYFRWLGECVGLFRNQWPTKELEFLKQLHHVSISIKIKSIACSILGYGIDQFRVLHFIGFFQDMMSTRNFVSEKSIPIFFFFFLLL